MPRYKIIAEGEGTVTVRIDETTFEALFRPRVPFHREKLGTYLSAAVAAGLAEEHPESFSWAAIGEPRFEWKGTTQQLWLFCHFIVKRRTGVFKSPRGAQGVLTRVFFARRGVNRLPAIKDMRREIDALPHEQEMAIWQLFQ